jgi:acyl carrier protein
MTNTIPSPQEMETELRSFITETFIFGQFPDQLENEDSLLETGVIDSTGILELIAFLEETFAIEIPDGEVVPENLDSIANIVQYVHRKRATA